MFNTNFYRRNLPHYQPNGAEFFITARLAGSLPKEAVEKLVHQQKLVSDLQLDSAELKKDEKIKYRKIFKKYEHLLESGSHGPTWLAKAEIANIVQEALFYRDQNEFDLYAFCIMPNHLHVIFKMLDQNQAKVEFPLTETLRKFKSFTGLKSNQKLGRSGAFWQEESYDHVIRDEDELEKSIKYILYNPVKAGLVEKWQDWEYSYCKPKLLKNLI